MGVTIYRVGDKGQLVDLAARRRKRDTRPSARRRGYDSRWERERRRYLRTFPTCRCGKQATQVHHIDGQGPKGPRGYDWGNLQAMCHACHSKHTAEHQPGGFAA